MSNRKTLATKEGFSLVEVTERDEDGNIISTSYEVYGPDGELLESFATIGDAQGFLKSVLPEPPKPSRGMSM